MPSQRDIRRRIGAVKNIKQITRAMQFVAASKLKRAQDSTLAARPYSEKIDEVLADLAAVLGADEHPLLSRREEGKRLLLTRKPLEAEDLPRAIRDSKQGRVEFRTDRTNLAHVPLGKVSFEEQKLLENLTAVMEAVTKAKPSGAKGQYIRSAFLTTTMGPGLELDLKSTQALAAG